MLQKTVRTWMTVTPTTVSHMATLEETNQLMRALHIRHLPVMDGENPIGLITRTDIYRAKLNSVIHNEQGGEATPHTVGHIVSSMPEVMMAMIDADESLATAAERMLTHHLTTLLVTDNGRLAGILTEADIFRMVIESD
jgi:CBS domain-containing membrane protein